MSIYNVREYGAAGNGRDDDGSKIARAIDELIENGGGVLYFPPGRYLTKRKHTFKNVALTIRGEGPGISVLIWDTIDGGLHYSNDDIEWTQRGNQPRQLFVESIALTTRQKYSGAAITMRWVDRVKAPHFTIRNINITGEMQDVDGRSTFNHMWRTGIESYGANVGVMENVKIIGSREISRTSDFKFSTGIHLHADSHSTDYNISNCTCYLYGNSLLFENVEGIYLSKFELVSTRIGIEANNCYGVQSSVGHIDYSAFGFKVNNSGPITISDCAAQHQGGDNLPGNSVELIGCRDIKITANRFHGPGGSLNSNGVLLDRYDIAQDNSENAVISGNTFKHFASQGIWLKYGTRRNKVYGNTFEHIGALSVYDQGEGNEVDA